MRNLKRALSAALASVMVLGLMVVGASAVGYEDFTDKAEIKNSEAVSTMVSLGVISGKEDGSYFDPAGSLTRAEACTLIARMLGGGKDPILGSNVKSSFSDTQGHWAESYVAYCANLGIIAGVGDGSFRPNDVLTGSAAAKMLVCALGYKPEFEGIGGAAWEIATNTLANKIKLYDGLDELNPSATISRDDVSQMIYNAVQAQEVEYRNLMGQYDGAVYPVENGSVLSNRFGVKKVTGILTANEHFGLDTASTKAGKSVIGGTQYNVSTDADMLGKEVVIYLKPADKLSPNPASDKVLGQAIVTNKNTVYVAADELVDNSAKSNDVTKTLKAEGLSLRAGMIPYVNYADSLTYDEKGDITSGLISTAAQAAALTGRGYTATFIDNTGDGKVDVILSYQPSFGKVAVYSTSGDGKITVTNLSSGSAALAGKIAEDVKGFENVAKNDYVFYTYIAADKTYYVEKAEGITVNVTATKGGATKMDDTITADGTSYKLSKIASATDISAADSTQARLTDAVSIGKSAVLYLDAAGYVVYVDEVETESNYLVVTTAAKTGDFNDSLKAKVILSDGTSTTVTVSKLDKKSFVASNPGSDETTFDTAVTALNNAATDKALNAIKVYKYTVDSDGNYELDTQSTKTASAISNNVPKVGADMVANTSTPIVVKGSGNPVLYTGINTVPTRKADDQGANAPKVVGVVNTSGVAQAIFVLGGVGANAESNYMYFLSAAPTVTKDADGKDVYTYDVVREGEITTVVGTSGSLLNGSAGLKLVTFKGEKADSVSTDGRTVTMSEVTSVGSGVVSNASASYYYNENTKVFEVKDGVATESSVEAITVQQKDNQDQVTIHGDTLAVMLGKDAANNTALYIFIVK